MLLIAISYLLGSLPFGLLLTKIFFKQDIRASGSGNIGATNVARVIGKKLGALTLALDLAKGFIAVFLAKEFSTELNGVILYIPHVVMWSSLAVVLGHLFPIWLKFNGGKGVATTLGVWLALDPIFALCAILIWIGAFIFTRISSLSAIITMILAPCVAFARISEIGSYNILYMQVFIALLVIIRHKDNIYRLINNSEHTIK